MKNCVNCGSVMNDNDMICPVCGYQNSNVNSEQIIKQEDSVVSGQYQPDNSGYQNYYQQNNYLYQSQYQQNNDFNTNQYQMGYSDYNAPNQGAFNPYYQGQPSQMPPYYQQSYTDFNAQEQYQGYNNPSQYPTGDGLRREPKKGNGKKIAIAIGSIVAVAAIFIVVFFVFIKGEKSASPKKVAENYVEALIKGDTKAISGYFPDKVRSNEKVKAIIEQNYNSKIDSVKSYKVLSETDIDGDDAQKYIEAMKEEYGVNVSSVKRIKMEIKMEFSGDEYSNNIELFLGKVGSEWCVIYDGIILNYSFSGPEGVAEKCVNALFDGDADTLMACFPDGMIKDSDREAFRSTIEYMAMLKSMIKSVNAGSSTTLTGSEAEKYKTQMKEEHSIIVDEVVSVPITYRIEFMGESQSQTMDIICGKIGSKWYVIGGIN